MGWCAPPWAPHAPRVGNPRGGGASSSLGGYSTPLAAVPPRRSHLLGPAHPLGGLYKGWGGGRAATPQVLAPPSPLLHLSLSQKLGEALLRSLLHPPPRRRATGSSSTSPSPLLDQGGDVIRSVRVLNAEVPSVRHLVIGDLDHGEYGSIIPVLLNASARDLQGYVDALSSHC